MFSVLRCSPPPSQTWKEGGSWIYVHSGALWQAPLPPTPRSLSAPVPGLGTELSTWWLTQGLHREEGVLSPLLLPAHSTGPALERGLSCHLKVAALGVSCFRLQFCFGFLFVCAPGLSDTSALGWGTLTWSPREERVLRGLALRQHRWQALSCSPQPRVAL